MSDLRTINPGIRRIGGIYTIKNDGEDMPKQPPAIINPGAVKRVTRARGEEQQIPQVEIYFENTEAGDRLAREEMKGALAGQTAKPAKEISYAQREARKQLASKKAVAEAERELIEEKVAKKIEKEMAGKKQKVEKGVITEIIPYVKKAEKASEKELAEIKLKKAETKLKIEEAKARKAETYLSFANARAKEIQAQKGVNWKVAKAEATDEWKKRSVKSPEGTYYITEPESSATSESTHRKRFEAMSERQKKLADTEGTDSGSYESTPSGHLKRKPKAITDKSGSESSKTKAGAGEEAPKPRMMKIKRKDGTIDILPIKPKVVDIEKEQKKAEQIPLKPGESAKIQQQSRLRQRDIVGFVEALSEDELKSEYRDIHPRKAFPTTLKMRNALIKALGGRVRGGKTVFSSTDEE